MLRFFIIITGIVSLVLGTCVQVALAADAKADHQNATDDKTAQQIIKDTFTHWKTIQDYQCKMKTFNRIGDLTDAKKLDFYYKRPGQVRVEVIEGENVGSVLTRDANGKIRGRKGGLLGIMAITLEEGDTRIKNMRGRPFYLGNWGAALDELLIACDRGWEVTRLPDEDFNGFPCYKIGIKWDDPDQTLTSEFLWIEKENKVILCRKQYEGDLMVNEVAWWEIQINKGLESSLFTQ